MAVHQPFKSGTWVTVILNIRVASVHKGSRKSSENLAVIRGTGKVGDRTGRTQSSKPAISCDGNEPRQGFADLVFLREPDTSLMSLTGMEQSLSSFPAKSATASRLAVTVWNEEWFEPVITRGASTRPGFPGSKWIAAPRIRSNAPGRLRGLRIVVSNGPRRIDCDYTIDEHPQETVPPAKAGIAPTIRVRLCIRLATIRHRPWVWFSPGVFLTAATKFLTSPFRHSQSPSTVLPNRC